MLMLSQRYLLIIGTPSNHCYSWAMLQSAVEILRRGSILAIPTETVYGLAAQIDHPEAIRRIFEIKGRPFFDPLIVHVCSSEMARTLTPQWGQAEEALSQKFWPGPLTLVLPKKSFVNDIITAGLPTVGIRMPRHPLTLDLIEKVGAPLAAPSANRFGKTSPTLADHVKKEFGDSLAVLDGGPCDIGIESTILAISPPSAGHPSCLQILRKGKVLHSQIDQALKQSGVPFEWKNELATYSSVSSIQRMAPGQMQHHYMPMVPFILLSSETKKKDWLSIVQKKLEDLPEEIESMKLVKPAGPIQHPKEICLSNNPWEATRLFYAQLRAQAEAGADLLYFVLKPLHEGEAWEPLLERMKKAASVTYCTSSTP